MSHRPIVVETLVRAPLAPVWALSQDPAEHTRWDVRFTRICLLPADAGSTARRFSYAVGPVRGVGVTAAERRSGDGSATSSLRFASRDPRSPIARGSGYWRYVPTPEGTRFLTGYTYDSRAPWSLVDPVVRVVLGWATAWSFDRFRLWLETGQTPEESRRRALTELAARGALAAGGGATAYGVGGGTVLTLVVALAVGGVLVLLPPHPRTPAARRCRRHPLDRIARTAPEPLARLADPEAAA